MSDLLPMFPLKLVVFPGEYLNLHVFEPRYKQLVMECETNDSTFGIPAFINNKIVSFGTEVRLLKIEKRYDNGEMDIRTQGIGIFQIIDFHNHTHNKLYASAEVKRLNELSQGDDATNITILDDLRELFKTMHLNKKPPIDSKQFVSFDVAHYVGFSLEQEYEFLCIPTEQARQRYLSAHLKQILPVVREMERLRERALLNGYFKHLNPPKF
jgi:Lon protease-like protein